MKRTPLLTIWAISLALMILFANEFEIEFWLSFTAFSILSVYMDKNKKRLEKEE